MAGEVPEDNNAKSSNMIEMPSKKPKANPTPEELELWRLEGLDEVQAIQGVWRCHLRREGPGIHRHLRSPHSDPRMASGQVPIS
jgi:hypothetical protein